MGQRARKRIVELGLMKKKNVEAYLKKYHAKTYYLILKIRAIFKYLYSTHTNYMSASRFKLNYRCNQPCY